MVALAPVAALALLGMSSALHMQWANGLLMLLSPREKKKSAAISSNKYW